MRKHRKPIIWSIVSIGFLISMLFIKVSPACILYAPYNGLSGYSSMYYVDEESISVDTMPKRNLLKVQMNPQLIKKTNTRDFKIRIPLIMLFDNRQTIGTPDMIDQGGYILEFSLLGFNKRFNIDPLEKIKYYPDLTEKISEKITAIDKEFKSKSN